MHGRRRRPGLAVAFVALLAPLEVPFVSGDARADEPSDPRPPLTLAPALVPIGIGAAAGLAGGATFWLSGASRRLVGPATLVAVSGFSLVAIGLLLDGYALLGPRENVPRAPEGPPRVETSFGYAYVYDPQFAYRSFLTESIDVRWRRLRLAPSAAFATNDPNARLRVLAGVRLLGPTPGGSGSSAAAPAPSRGEDGSFLDLEAAATHRAFRTEGFATATGELFASGRLDMGRVARTFDGAFAETGAGWAMASTSYAAGGASDLDSLLLFRAATGVYLGRGPESGGEAFLYYDHRHDDLAGGLLMHGVVSGVFGHFGAGARVYFLPEWGAAADVEGGAALLAGLSLLYRWRPGAEP